MQVTKVCCQGCGADLQIDESIRFVTCNYQDGLSGYESRRRQLVGQIERERGS